MGDNHRIAKRVQLTCPQCKNGFERFAYYVKHASNPEFIFCSRVCAARYQAIQRYAPNRAARLKRQEGEKAEADAQFNSSGLEGEIWKPIPEWTAYEVSSFGRVRRVGIGHGTYKYPHLLKQQRNKKGYLLVGLRQSGRFRSAASVHSLVMEAFVGPRPPKMVINHKDGVKSNNRPENLEYCTNAENMKHAGASGLMARGEASGIRKHPEKIKRGEMSPFAKLTDGKVLEIMQLLAAGHSAQSLAVRYGVSGNRVSMIRLGKTWRHITRPPKSHSKS